MYRLDNFAKILSGNISEISSHPNAKTGPCGEPPHPLPRIRNNPYREHPKKHPFVKLQIALCLFLVCLFGRTLPIIAQPTDSVRWDHRLPSFGSDAAADLIFAPSGELVLVGTTGGGTLVGSDLLIARLDGDHNVTDQRAVDLGGVEGANAVVAARDGNYLVAGYTNHSKLTGHAGGRDALLLKLAPDGRDLWYALAGGDRSDEFHALAQADDGSIVAVGERDGRAFAMGFAADGTRRWTEMLDDGSESTATGVAFLPSSRRDLLVVGNAGPRQETLFLQTLTLDGKAGRRQTIPDANALAVRTGPDGFLYVAGRDFAGKRRDQSFLKRLKNAAAEVPILGGGRGDGLLLRVDARLEIHYLRSYGEEGFDEFRNLVVTPDRNIILVGGNMSFRRAARRPLAWVLRTDLEGVPLGDELMLGGKDEDVFHGVATALDGSTYVVGSTKSGKLARDPWIVQLEDGGPFAPDAAVELRVSAPQLLDDNGDGMIEVGEEGLFRLEVTNRSNQLAERLRVELEFPDATKRPLDVPPALWVPHLPPGATRAVFVPFRAPDQIDPATVLVAARIRSAVQRIQSNAPATAVELIPEPEPEFVVSGYRFVDAAGDSLTLAPRDQPIRLILQFANRGTRAAEGITVRFNMDRYLHATGETVFQIDRLEPGETRLAALDLRLDPLYEADELSVRYSISESGVVFEKRGAARLPVALPAVAATPEPEPPVRPDPVPTGAPDFVVTAHRFINADGDSLTAAPHDQLTRLILTFTNRGTRTASGVVIGFSTDPQVRTLGKETFRLGELPPGEGHLVAFDFKLNEGYNAEQVSIRYALAEPGGGFEERGAVTLPVVVMEPVVATIPDPVPEPVAADFSWISPRLLDPDAGWTPETARVTLILDVFSPLELTETDFVVMLDSVPYELTEKFDKVKLLAAKDGTLGSGRTKFTYQVDVDFPRGNYPLWVELQREGVTGRSSVLHVRYALERPNLFVLSIGVPGQGLRFPGTDAYDFAETLRNAPGMQATYDSIEVVIMNDSLATRENEIERAFENYANRGKSGEIRAEDVMMIFISSHGFTQRNYEGQNVFYLQPSDYDGTGSTALACDDAILEPLRYVPATKLVFLDACHSGAIRTRILGEKSGGPRPEVPSAVLDRILNDRADIRFITSCRPGERSYEHEDWKNGAFTEAILEGFRNEAHETIDRELFPNRDTDTQLTVAELCNYLKVRVPHMVKQSFSQKPDQNPAVRAGMLSDTFPVFVY